MMRRNLVWVGLVLGLTLGSGCKPEHGLSAEQRETLRAEIEAFLTASEQGDAGGVEESTCLDLFGPLWVDEKARFGVMGDLNDPLAAYQAAYHADLAEELSGLVRLRLEDIDFSLLKVVPAEEMPERVPSAGYELDVRVRGVVGVHLRGRSKPYYWTTVRLDDRWCIQPVHLP